MSDAITVSKAELKALIDAAVAEAQQNYVPPPGMQLDMAALGAAISEGMERNAPKKITFGNYIKRVHSSTHPDPAFPNGPVLIPEVLVNGYHITAIQSTDAEINLLNKINRSGRYINRLVEVAYSQVGNESALDIRYNNTKDSGLSQFSRSFKETLEQIVAAQEEENAEERDVLKEQAARKAARRAFGMTKATQEAYARAEKE